LTAKRSDQFFAWRAERDGSARDGVAGTSLKVELHRHGTPADAAFVAADLQRHPVGRKSAPRGATVEVVEQSRRLGAQ
jgi:hypothetical protein